MKSKIADCFALALVLCVVSFLFIILSLIFERGYYGIFFVISFGCGCGAWFLLFAILGIVVAEMLS